MTDSLGNRGGSCACGAPDEKLARLAWNSSRAAALSAGRTPAALAPRARATTPRWRRMRQPMVRDRINMPISGNRPGRAVREKWWSCHWIRLRTLTKKQYLSANPDVRDAVAAGTVLSGLVHYLSWGRHEKRPRPVVRRPLTWQDKVNEVWSVSPEEKSKALGWYWMAHPMVRERINTLVSRDQSLDAYARLGAWLNEHGRKLPLDRSISLGCGFGGLERDLVSRGIIREMDAFDPPPAPSPRPAGSRTKPATAGSTTTSLIWRRRTSHPVTTMPCSPTALCIMSSGWRCCSQPCAARCVRVASFTSTNTSARRGSSGPMPSCTSSTLFLTRSRNVFVRTPTGRKPPVLRPTIEQMVAMDPTEAVRSSDIRGVLSQYFTIVEERPVRRHIAAHRARRHRTEF